MKQNEALKIIFDTNRVESICLLYLLKNPEKKIYEVDIEKATGLRQPEISVAIKKLSKFGFISIEHEKSKGRGRPKHVYRFTVPKEKILDIIEKEAERKKSIINEAVTVLKKAVSKWTI